MCDSWSVIVHCVKVANWAENRLEMVSIALIGGRLTAEQWLYRSEPRPAIENGFRQPNWWPISTRFPQKCWENRLPNPSYSCYPLTPGFCNLNRNNIKQISTKLMKNLVAEPQSSPYLLIPGFCNLNRTDNKQNPTKLMKNLVVEPQS